MALKPGDKAPEWNLLAAVDGRVAEVSLAGLLEGNGALVLTTYPLDFSGG